MNTPKSPRSGIVPPLIDREPAGALPGSHGPRGPIPDDARAQLGECVGRVAAGEQVEDRR